MLDRLFLPEGSTAVVFAGDTWVKLTWQADSAELRFAGRIELSARRELMITGGEDLEDTVKEDRGFRGLSVTIEGTIYNAAVLDSVRVPVIDLQFTRPLGAAQSALAVKEVKGILRALRAPRGTRFEIEDAEGFLADIGINTVVLEGADVRQEGRGRWRYTMRAEAELVPDAEGALFEYE